MLSATNSTSKISNSKFNKFKLRIFLKITPTYRVIDTTHQAHSTIQPNINVAWVQTSCTFTIA